MTPGGEGRDRLGFCSYLESIETQLPCTHGRRTATISSHFCCFRNIPPNTESFFTTGDQTLFRRATCFGCVMTQFSCRAGLDKSEEPHLGQSQETLLLCFLWRVAVFRRRAKSPNAGERNTTPLRVAGGHRHARLFRFFTKSICSNACISQRPNVRSDTMFKLVSRSKQSRC